MPVPVRDAIRFKDPAQFRYIGKGELKIVDGPDIVSGKAQYGIDTRLPGMLYAVVARPPVYGGKVKSFDAADALKVPGVVKVVQIDPSAAPPQFKPLGGVAVVAQNTWAAIKGRNALKIEWDDGTECDLRLRRLQGGTRGSRAQAGKVGAERRRLRRRDRQGRTQGQRGVLPAAPRPRDDRAARSHGAHRARQVRGLGLLPVAPGGPGPHREAARPLPRGRHGERHAARRRLRAEVQARFRHRGGVAVEGDGREAGQGHLDARGRPASRLLPHRLGRVPGSGARRAGAADRLAAPQRRAEPDRRLRRRREAEARARARAWA